MHINARRWLKRVCGLFAPRSRGHSSNERTFICSFSFLYREVVQSLSILVTDGTAMALAHRYMKHVLEHQDHQWWSEAEEYAHQPWFVWQYACEHGLVTRPVKVDVPLRVMPIMPERDETSTILLLRIERNAMQPDQGFIHLHGVQEALTEEQAKQLRCRYIPGGYVRKVDECAAPIIERAVQMGVMLLNQGFGVCVQEQALYERILCSEYEPEHLYWVRAAEAVDWLRLTYPYNVELHGYLLQMGGRWTGKQMLLPVTASNRLRDIVRLYNFRMTAEAQRRLALWEEACRNATIYKPRRLRNEPPQIGAGDLFRQMLEQKADVPADLIDPADG